MASAMRTCNGPAKGMRCPMGALIPTGQTYCDECGRTRDRRRGTKEQRGYGREHEQTRAELLPSAYGQPCRYCGNRMWPHEHLALDHTEDRKGYRGIVHADYRDCPAGGNAAEGAGRGNRER